MKKLITSTVLTLAAVPFLMAAPAAAKKAQNASTPASQNKSAVKKSKKQHTKKSHHSKPAKDTGASSKK